MKNQFLLLATIAIMTLYSCKVSQLSNQTIEQQYQNAIANSIYPTESKVDSNLIVIDHQNPNLTWKTINNEDYILAVAWKENASYYHAKLDTFFYTGDYPIWVTTASELKGRFSKEAVADTAMRLKQLLGLPPIAKNKTFIEFWVKPEDLFRPCPDKEINDNRCETCFPANVDAEHKAWINDYRISSYYSCELYQKFPWTQLGYTYDWNPKNKTHIGLSEFVIGKNKNIFIKGIYTTSAYLNQ